MLSKGDIVFGLVIIGIGAGVMGIILGITYGIIIVAKWAWES